MMEHISRVSCRSKLFLDAGVGGSVSAIGNELDEAGRRGQSCLYGFERDNLRLRAEFAAPPADLGL
jgi:hypothetical protein